MRSRDVSASRRGFIKQAALATGAAGALGACDSVAPTPESESGGSAETGSGGLALTVAGYPLDRVQAMNDGRVEIYGCSLSFQKGGIGELNTHVFSGPRTIDVTEIGLHPYMLAFANEDFRAYSLLPIFPIRVFRHKSIFVRTDRGIERPQDMRGKRIVTPGYSST